jgi:hypothetical protein
MARRFVLAIVLGLVGLIAAGTAAASTTSALHPETRVRGLDVGIEHHARADGQLSEEHLSGNLAASSETASGCALAARGAGGLADEAAQATTSGLRTAEEAGISAADAARIQAVATRTNQTITVVGSRAAGTAGRASDWDYILSGLAKARHFAQRFLPRGPAGTGSSKGIDVIPGPVDPSRPHVIFKP